MAGYTIVEIIISLSFIFLIYSLLTTILVEIIASVLRLRARNLRKAIRRMLQDETCIEAPNFGEKIRMFFNSKRTERQFVKDFFERPSIKYLGRSASHRSPSYIEASDFSKTLLDLLSTEAGYSDLEKIENALEYYPQFDQKMSFANEDWEAFSKGFISSDDKRDFIKTWTEQFNTVGREHKIEFNDMDIHELMNTLSETRNPRAQFNEIQEWKEKLNKPTEIEAETRLHLCTLYKNSGGDLNEFKLLIEEWFNNTMDRAKGWYKQWISRITFFCGLFIAISFNVDTIFITKQLQDNTLRSEMVINIENFSQNNAELQSIKDSLQIASLSINKTLSLTGYPNLTVQSNPDPEIKFYDALFPLTKRIDNAKWFIALLGWLLTAIAISFGAPFWFDLLNKLMKLRTSFLPKTADKESTSTETTASSNNTERTYKKQAKG